MSRVLKARYFPNTDFLNARLGNNLSFIWRSLFETQEILKNNIRRRVGNGRDIHVWADAWLPGQGSVRIQSARPPGVQDMNVPALRNYTGKEWNRERITSIFDAVDRDLILSIPISSADRRGGFWWTGENNGNFSVKSCYRKLTYLSPSGEADSWTKLWELEVPPKFKYFVWQVLDGSLPTVDNLRKKGVQITEECKLCGREAENLEHVFWECEYAHEVWQQAGVTRAADVLQVQDWIKQQLRIATNDHKSKFVALLWGLWKRRNSLIWKAEWQGAAGVITSAMSMITNWREAQQSSSQPKKRAGGGREQVWRRPGRGVVKVNVDAAFDPSGDKRAWGWVARDEQGNFLKAGGASVRASWSPAETEAAGLREALEEAVAAGWQSVEFETDALSVVQGLRQGGGFSYIDLILEDIKEILLTKSNYRVSFFK
ncbi:unnamed protein product [Cuscuta epithymum]|uniref:Reverse transcriptase zinc-binding domain-containing protein n=1 Tax=Cuscuta epithymum TaxID=186058 RepID=A0AAV0FID4_9ASTE|nr:unnamed protein product [Cuscuta epithymum]